MSERDVENAATYAADLHRQGEVETATKVKRKRPWIGRMVGLSFVGVLVGAAIIGVMRLANDPVSGAVSVSQLKASISPTPFPPGHIGGLYFSMSYPGVYNQVSQIKTDSMALEQYRIGSSASYRRTLTISVRDMQNGRLIDDSSYRLRQIQSSTYTQTTRAMGSETAEVMTKVDASEVTFFWMHRGKLLIVSVTTSEPGDHATQFADMMLSSVRWLS